METSVVGTDVQTSPERRPKQARDEVLEDSAFLPEGENEDFPEDDEVHRLAPSPGPVPSDDLQHGELDWDRRDTAP